MKSAATILACLFSVAALAQEAVPHGGGSFAAFEPLRFARKAEGGKGDQSAFMQTRPLYMTARNAGKPLPTNDWWTDALVSQWTGNLWSYPAKVRIGAGGVRVAFPKHWSDDGTEVCERSALRVFASSSRPFTPAAALVDDWHNWDVEIVLADGDRQIRTTLVHGSPFTWIESRGVDLFIAADAGEGGPLVEQRSQDDGGEIFAVGEDLYGVWRGGEGDRRWIAIGLLPSEDAYKTLAPYASAIVRETRVDWRYDPAKAEVATVWRVKTEDLNGVVSGKWKVESGVREAESGKWKVESAGPPALQGFQPHHLKKTRQNFKCLDGLVWQTPRGRQRVAAGNDLEIVYPFPGILPYWPAPQVTKADNAKAASYDPALFKTLVSDYAERGTFGHDTYWGGKGLLQMAFAMMAAREAGDDASFVLARDRLREVLVDWLTYKPGDESRFFAFVPKWGGLVGIHPSYDSETFNDHHFHYGYFTYSGALLCLVDGDFAQQYGPMLKLVAKDYANWDRADPLFPFLRTFDPWAGHSFAGGMGDGNGNGQESSSEAMQGWGGLFLLGLALGDDAMTAAGAFGYAVESRAVAEYWFDRDRENIDRSKYRHPYCCNLTCHGVGWWTFFSGDPAWMHSIQWLPDTPALDYLSEDLAFAKWDWETMWASKEIGGWFEKGRDKAGNETPCVGDASLGNVFLSYLRRHDPAQASRIFAELREKGLGAAVNPDTAHMTYWSIHSQLAWGGVDASVRADFPAARAYRGDDGQRAFAAYNTGREPRTVTFFDNAGKAVGRLVAAPQALTVQREGGNPVSSPIPAAPRKVTLNGAAMAKTLPATLLAQRKEYDKPDTPTVPDVPDLPDMSPDF